MLTVGIAGACGGQVGIDGDRAVPASGGSGAGASSGGKGSASASGGRSAGGGSGGDAAIGGTPAKGTGGTSHAGGAFSEPSGGASNQATGGGDQPDDMGLGGAGAAPARIEGIPCEPTPYPLDPQRPSHPPRDLFVCGIVTAIDFVREEGPARLVVLEPPDPDECGSLVQVALALGNDHDENGVLSESEVTQRIVRCTTLGPEGSVRLFTQAQVEEYADTVSFPADLTLYNFVADLTPLSSLQEVRGAFTINGTALQTLSGLGSLHTVDSLWVGFNKELSAVGSLPALVEANHLVFVSNPKLQSLEGLESVQWAKSVAVSSAAVRGLEGLEGLQVVEQGLTISDCPELTSLRALEGLKSVGSLSIHSNPNLPSCEIEWLLGRIEVQDQEESSYDEDDGVCP